MAITCVLTDVEGTTSSIAFVSEVLFPYARLHLPTFLAQRQYEPHIAAHIAGVRRTAHIGDEGIDTVCATLLQWITADRKDPDLKALQGMVWADGYATGAFTSHVYPDVPAALAHWRSAGLRLAVYSSGSVQAQRLFFAHSGHGDLSSLFCAHFDTQIGAKRDPESYRRIAAELDGEILFLSDTVAELDAAAMVGLHTHLICRDHVQAVAGHPMAKDFHDVERHWALGSMLTAVQA